MTNKRKVVRNGMTNQGFPIKVWVRRGTGEVCPTHWKIQAGWLSIPKKKNQGIGGL